MVAQLFNRLLDGWYPVPEILQKRKSADNQAPCPEVDQAMSDLLESADWDLENFTANQRAHFDYFRDRFRMITFAGKDCFHIPKHPKLKLIANLVVNLPGVKALCVQGVNEYPPANYNKIAENACAFFEEVCQISGGDPHMYKIEEIRFRHLCCFPDEALGQILETNPGLATVEFPLTFRLQAPTLAKMFFPIYHLENLSLSHIPLSEEQMIDLLDRNRQMKTLHLSSRISWNGAKLCLKIGKFYGQQLIALSLPKMIQPDLRPILACAHLRSLSLTGITEPDIFTLLSKRSPRLASLALYDTPITEADLQSASPMNELKSLTLHGERDASGKFPVLNKGMIEKLIDLCPSVESLTLTNWVLAPSDAPLFARFAKLKSLEAGFPPC